LLLLAASAHQLSAQTLVVSDSFTDADGIAPGHMGETAPNVWKGSTLFTIESNVLRSASGSSNGHFLAIDLGTDYFTTNPAIYELSADLQYSAGMSDPTDFMSIGFTIGHNTGNANRNHLSTNTSSLYGAPSITINGNGQALVNAEQATTLYSSATGVYAADTAHTVKLVLDTTATAWTVEAYVGGAQLDLDSGSSSMLYTFSANPAIRYLSISSNVQAADTSFYSLDNVIMQTVVSPVPEPSTYALFLGMIGLGYGAFRRSRKSKAA
jgi:hypothetical protein